MTLPASEVDELRRIGGGNVSQGVSRLLIAWRGSSPQRQSRRSSAWIGGFCFMRRLRSGVNAVTVTCCPVAMLVLSISHRRRRRSW